MEYLTRLRDGPDNNPDAKLLLSMIKDGNGTWEKGWQSINNDSSKNLYCPICFKSMNRVLPDRHPACWC